MVRTELSALVKLALPLILAHAGNQLMSVVDTAMVGRLGPASLAGVGIGNGIFFSITLTGLGCVLGMDALVSQALGAGDPRRAWRVLRDGAMVGLLVAIPAVLLAALVPFALPWAKVDPATAIEARHYLWARLGNIPPFLLFAAGRSFLQAHGQTRPIVWAMVLGNGANFLGNALFIYGDAALLRIGLPGIGLPALGVVGSGLSSTVASILMVLVLARAIGSPERVDAEPSQAQLILRQGLPVGLQLLAEVGVFALVGVLAGRLSAQAAAGHQIALTIASLTFTVTIGIAAATSVRVGLAVGQANQPAARRAGLLGLGVGTGFMTCAALVLLLSSRILARVLAPEPTVIEAALPLIFIAALFQISDGLQAIAAGALRGVGDARVPLVANLLGHYGVGLPIALLLGFGLHWGAPGLWWGLLAGLTTVALGLCYRFVQVTARPIRRLRDLA